MPASAIPPDPEGSGKLVAAIRARAAALGFEAFGIAPAEANPATLQRLTDWLAAGYHGDMAWMNATPERRADPAVLWPEVRSILMFGANYGIEGDALAPVGLPDRGAIALYARRRDYHDTLKGRLKELGGYIVARAGGDVKVFVDTAPVMEKPLAMAAGLGWQGKNSLLVSRAFGSWLFLGAIYTTLPLPATAAGEDHCGRCTRCLDACPTAAFPAPYVLDSSRCIAYLTIEHAGPIAPEFRVPMGNRIFGCDDCLAVCPWNKFAEQARDAKLALKPELEHPELAMLAGLDEAGFRAFFAGTPIKRTGRARLLRNVLIAIGNSGDPALAGPARALLDDAEPLVRGMAIWALARLLPAEEVMILADGQAGNETDPAVREEWRAATGGLACA